MSHPLHRTFRVLTILQCISLVLTACANATPEQPLTILPASCNLSLADQIGLTLNGAIAPNAQVTWQASLGSIVKNAQGYSAIYTAPNTMGADTITATISPGLRKATDTLTLICNILDELANTPPTFQTNVPIVISEVMGNPCGGMDVRKYNQYVELYNHGDAPVDVDGWWIFDEGQAGTPDELTSWDSRSAAPLTPGVILNSTVIAPHGFAVVLSPIYADGNTPYRFPSGTVILTAESSETLGDDFFGIISDENGYDTLTLYLGGSTVIQQVVDTYGTPAIKGPYTVNIDDDHRDGLPLHLSDCIAAERIDPLKPDGAANWTRVLNGTPGEGPY